jgi:hypothetical protein
MNMKRILLGGLVAGVVANLIGFGINVGLLERRYKAGQASGLFLQEPRLPFVVIQPLLLLAIGVVLAWLYAAARPRLGPGPKTAILVGLAVAFVAAVPPNFDTACWSPVGRFMPLMWMIMTGAQCVAGTLVAGALYKE